MTKKYMVFIPLDKNKSTVKGRTLICEAISAIEVYMKYPESILIRPVNIKKSKKEI